MSNTGINTSRSNAFFDSPLTYIDFVASGVQQVRTHAAEVTSRSISASNPSPRPTSKRASNQTSSPSSFRRSVMH